MTEPNPRVLLVTGASSGIGRAVALLAARRGDHVALLARAVPPLESVAAECSAAGAASVLVLPADVGDDSAVRAAFVRLDEEHGRLDAVVHAAGVVSYGRTEEVPAGVFEGVLRTNLLGSVNVSRHAIGRMRASANGTIVLVGSVIGHLAVPTMSPYTISKWGVRVLARQLQIENRDRPGLHVCYVAPGGVDTPIYARAANYTGRPGSPPPPVASPERVARVVLRRLDRPRARTQSGALNDVMRFGFSVMPWVYDRLVGPLFSVLATDRSGSVAPTDGAVLVPQHEDALR